MIVVTGATGHLGRLVVESLREKVSFTHAHQGRCHRGRATCWRGRGVRAVVAEPKLLLGHHAEPQDGLPVGRRATALHRRRASQGTPGT
jgi:uncharacterized protein YbjT (DUF2867 family)